jgi:hypothetical protein
MSEPKRLSDEEIHDTWDSVDTLHGHLVDWLRPQHSRLHAFARRIEALTEARVRREYEMEFTIARQHAGLCSSTHPCCSAVRLLCILATA